MPKEMKIVTKDNPGMMFTISFVLVACINFVVFYLANMFFPHDVVLGTVSIPAAWAILLSGIFLSMFTVLLMPFLTEWENKRGSLMSPVEMMVIYLLINGVGLWLLTRKSEFFGLGVSSWFVVAAVAVVLDLVQGLVMMQVEKMRKSALGLS